MTIWAMIETPTAILDIRAIAGTRRVNVLVMGNNDLAKELRTGVLPERTPLMPALAMALLGAREAGKVILDGVYNDVNDADGFLPRRDRARRWASTARRSSTPARSSRPTPCGRRAPTRSTSRSV